ncbi:MAG: DUF805 domain-containing protein [Deltaproteobacteria bacterium]|jgi:uncharacterized membrane protein YhaH (DUF805 family)|nr:DUF805 domain-containing protein [Deltaproteobacteria bacterium]
MNYVIHALRNPFTYTGRASRAEFWCFFFFGIAVQAVIALLMAAGAYVSATVVLVLLYVMIATSAAAFVVFLSLCVRRAHDFGTGGWIAVPMILFLPILIICGIIDGHYRTNRYGPKPKALDF